MNKIYKEGDSLSRFIIFIVIFTFFRPTIFEKFEFTNAIFNGLLIMALVLCALDSIKRNCLPKDIFFLGTLLFYGTILYSTSANNGSLPRALMYILTGIFTVVFVRYMLQLGLLYAARIMRKLLWIYVIMNFATIVLYPNGIVQTGNSDSAVYLLGQPTRYAFFYLPALLFCFLEDQLLYSRIRKNTIIIYGICLASLLAAWTVGSSIALLCVIILLLHSDWKIFNWKFYYPTQILLHVGLVYFSIQEVFTIFIEQYLHKDATLSSRTLIWMNAKEMIEDSPLYGIGIFDNVENKEILGFVHAHAHLLHITYQGGYVALVIFLLLLLICYKRLQKFGQSLEAKCLAFFVFILGIQLLVDSVDGVRNHYLFLIAMGAYYSYFKNIHL